MFYFLFLLAIIPIMIVQQLKWITINNNYDVHNGTYKKIS